MERENHLLEINLISGQGLKTPSANLRRLQTYAIAWIDPKAKLRTRIDRVGAENPTWNEKFLFRVTSDFLSSDTSAVSIEIYAVGYIKDPLLGTVRFLLNTSASSPAIGTPAFTAVQIRRPSGRFHGVLNIAATVLDGLHFTSIAGLSAVCFRDLIGESCRWRRRDRRRRSEKSQQSSCGESCDLDFSDGADSTSSSSSSAASTALKEINCETTTMAGKIDLRSDGGGLLCCLMPQRRIHLSSSVQNFRSLVASQEKEN